MIPRTISRRTVLVAGAAALASRPALAQVGAAPAGPDAPVMELAQAGPLGDAWLGPEGAKCTIVEYASLTCTHCAAFHKETWPTLKSRYVDTGKVRFTLREFPLDPLATAGFMLARSDGGAKYYAITDLLFDQQKSWAFVDKPLDALRAMMRQAGFSAEKFDATLKDQKLYDAINAVKTRAYERFKVDSTPTFFVNGKRQPGNASIEEFEKLIKPIVGA